MVSASALLGKPEPETIKPSARAEGPSPDRIDTPKKPAAGRMEKKSGTRP